MGGVAPSRLTLHAHNAYSVCMKRRQTARKPGKTRPDRRLARPRPAADRIQYTVRNVPRKADEALRRRADELDVSLNDVLLRALLKEAGMAEGEKGAHHDLDDFVGSWEEDPEFDAIIAEQDRVDEEKWK